MQYVDIKDAIEEQGLRIVIVKQLPSPWGVAAKAMMEFKGLKFVVAHQIPLTENHELLEWAGVNSAPVVAWKDEPPLNRWNDILFLLERLEPRRPLIPEVPAQRILTLGLSHEICGELGFGWNRRLDFARPKDGEDVSELGKKWGYRVSDAEMADARIVAFMRQLADIMIAQREIGSRFLVGNAITAADFYWAAFSNLVSIQPHSQCPMIPEARPIFENTPEEITSAIDPILIEHRDFIMQNYFKLPLEL